jgi:hypothetical protein
VIHAYPPWKYSMRGALQVNSAKDNERIRTVGEFTYSSILLAQLVRLFVVEFTYLNLHTPNK